MMTETQARAILEKAKRFSKADAVDLTLAGNESGNIRFARNTVTTAGSQTEHILVVSSAFGKREGQATTNRFDDASIEQVVRHSEELARLAPENPEYMPPIAPQQYTSVPAAYVPATAAIDPALRAQAAADSIGPCRSRKLTAAGFLEDSASFQMVMNSNGLYGYHRSTNAEFTVTVRSDDGTGSGWACATGRDIREVDAKAAAQIAIEKAEASRNPVALEPGKYTAILEPAASVGLISFMTFFMGARPADEGRSFLSKAGGGNRKGERLMGENVTLSTDPQNAALPGAPWTDDNLPAARYDLIKNGVVENLYYSRYWAEKSGKQPLGQPTNLIMAGGPDGTTADIIRDTRRGILVTRTWYIRLVDPQTVLLTGLTRDGTFLVENGKITRSVKNFRWNESPVIMLNNIEKLGTPVRVLGSENSAALIPPMRVRDFTFSSLSDAV